MCIKLHSLTFSTTNFVVSWYLLSTDKVCTNVRTKDFLTTVDTNKADSADGNEQFSGCPHHTPLSEALMLTAI